MMKKALSLAMALAVAAAMAVTAHAAGDIKLSFHFIGPGGEDMTTQSLLPDREYRFPVLAQEEGESLAQLTEEGLEGKRFTAAVRKGSSAIQTPELETEDGKCYLVVRTKANYATKPTDVEFQARLIDKSSGRELGRTTAGLTVGFPAMSDSTIDNMAEGDALMVDNEAPIVTAKQFDKLAKLNSYRAVTLSGDQWEYDVLVTDLSARNLYATNAAFPEIVQKYEGAEFKFLTFPGAPDFGVQGELSISVADVEDDFDGVYYLYRYLGGKLFYLNSQYDEGEGTVTFRPSQLGAYVITDRKLTDLAVGGSGGPASGGPASAGTGGDGNPDTGDHSAAGLALALALCSAACAAVLSKQH